MAALESAVAELRRVPAWVWVVLAVVVLWWCGAGPNTRHANSAGPAASDDEQLSVSHYGQRPGYDPFVPAHAPGYPYVLGYVCPDIVPGRRKHYPEHTAGVFAMLANPDPQDDDMYPWVSYGGPR